MKAHRIIRKQRQEIARLKRELRAPVKGDPNLSFVINKRTGEKEIINDVLRERDQLRNELATAKIVSSIETNSTSMLQYTAENAVAKCQGQAETIKRLETAIDDARKDYEELKNENNNSLKEIADARTQLLEELGLPRELVGASLKALIKETHTRIIPIIEENRNLKNCKDKTELQGCKKELAESQAKLFTSTGMHGEELRRRAYYQNIVMFTCTIIDKLFANAPGCGVRCGTVTEPSTEVQEHMQKIADTMKFRGERITKLNDELDESREATNGVMRQINSIRDKALACIGIAHMTHSTEELVDTLIRSWKFRLAEKKDEQDDSSSKTKMVIDEYVKEIDQTRDKLIKALGNESLHGSTTQALVDMIVAEHTYLNVRINRQREEIKELVGKLQRYGRGTRLLKEIDLSKCKVGDTIFRTDGKSGVFEGFKPSLKRREIDQFPCQVRFDDKVMSYKRDGRAGVSDISKQYDVLAVTYASGESERKGEFFSSVDFGLGKDNAHFATFKITDEMRDQIKNMRGPFKSEPEPDHITAMRLALEAAQKPLSNERLEEIAREMTKQREEAFKQRMAEMKQRHEYEAASARAQAAVNILGSVLPLIFAGAFFVPEKEGK